MLKRRVPATIPYDWNGPKKPVVCACEADSDAALTMQILHLLTNDPVVFMDVRHYDKDYDVMVFCNCGSQSTYYAAASDDPKGEPGRRSHCIPAWIFMPAAAAINLTTKPGKATIARLNRTEGKYRMTIIPTGVRRAAEEENGGDHQGVAPRVCQAALLTIRFS